MSRREAGGWAHKNEMLYATPLSWGSGCREKKWGGVSMRKQRLRRAPKMRMMVCSDVLSGFTRNVGLTA